MSAVPSPAVDVRQLSVRYGRTAALRAVDLTLQPGEVHAVVGENGAGKSTLLRAIAGMVLPETGEIRLRSGATVAWVPQEPELPPDLTVTDWIFLAGEQTNSFGWLRQRAMEEVAAAALGAVGCGVGPRARVGTLGPAQRKQVQLARAVRTSPTVLLLDEPSAVLGEGETLQLFAVMRRLTQEGTAVLYVSHRLGEVLAAADRVTVLRDGAVISTDPVAAVDEDQLVQRMVGRAVPPRAHREAVHGRDLLRIVDAAIAHVEGVSLTVRQGEVVGLAGLLGAGRSELLEGVAGLRPLRSGRVERSVGPVLLPEDRLRNGLVPSFSLRENLFLPASGWRIDRGRERRESAEWIDALAIRASGSEAPIGSLSGGNQQKLLLARALRQRPALLLLDEPTAGVDVGAKAEIHAHIARLANSGTAILMASSDLPELLFLCDRIVALRAGRIAGILAAAEATEAKIAALITGAKASIVTLDPSEDSNAEAQRTQRD